jgi:hypothetical protein
MQTLRALRHEVPGSGRVPTLTHLIESNPSRVSTGARDRFRLAIQFEPSTGNRSRSKGRLYAQEDRAGPWRVRTKPQSGGPFAWYYLAGQPPMCRITNRARATVVVATSSHCVSHFRLKTIIAIVLPNEQLPCQIRAASFKRPYPKRPGGQTPANTPRLSRRVTPDKVLAFIVLYFSDGDL